MKQAFGVAIFAVGLLQGVEARLSSAHADEWGKCENVKEEETAIKACSRLFKRKNLSLKSRGVARKNLGLAYFIRAIRYRDTGNGKKAIEAYQEGQKYTKLSKDLIPGMALAYNLRGNEYFNEGKFDAALGDFNEAIKQDPKLSKAYTNRGNILFYNKRRPQDALPDFNKSIKLEPNNFRPYLGRARALKDTGNLREAIPDFGRAIKLMYEEGAPLAGQAAAAQKKGDKQLFDSLGRKLLERQKMIADAYYYRGNTYEHLKERAKAISDMKKALELHPDHPHAQNNLDLLLSSGARANASDGKGKDADAATKSGVKQSQQGKADDAIASYTEAIAKNPADFWAWIQRGEVYKKKGEYDKAVADIKKGFELAPNEDARKQSLPHLLSGLYVRGYRHLEKGKHDLAIADFSEVIKLKPDHFWAWRDRGKAHLNLSQNDKAIADETEAIRINPKSAEAHEYRAVSHFESGDYERAIEDISQTISLKPKKDAWAHAVRAISLLRAGRASDGIPDIELALRLKPKNANYLETYGHILEELGRKEEALAAYRKALEINPQKKPSQEGVKRLEGSP